MTEKRKHRLRPLTSILANLNSPEPSRREGAIGKYADLAPEAGAVLGVLLRGLNDPDELVRMMAMKGLLGAFPSAESALSQLLDDIASDDPKVPLAAEA